MNELIIQKFDLKRLDECVELYMKTYSQEPWNESWESKNVVIDFIKNHCKNNYFIGFIALLNEKVIAVSLGYKKPWINGMEYYIDEFFVSADYHRQGIGAKFMTAIKNDLMTQNIHAIILSTQRNYPAHKFYESLGFNVLEDTIFLAVEF